MASPCPVPQVEEALRPYIKTRQEVLQIRQAVNRKLQQSSGDNALITPLTHLSSNGGLNSVRNSIATEGVRRRYLEALQAHQYAQTTYAAVKADLEQMRKGAPTTQGNDKAVDIGKIKAYAQSVRQRKQKDKLEALQRALTRLDDLEPHPVKIDVKATVKERLGDPPDAPHLVIGDDEVDSRIEELTVGLKKSIIQAKADLDTAKEDRLLTRRRVEEHGDIRLELRLSAFQAARQELIQWIESELTKVVDEDDQSQISEEHVDDTEHSSEEIQAQVSKLYERYVASRAALVHKVEYISTDTQLELPEINMAAQLSPSKTKDTTKPSVLSASELLSFLPALMQLSRDEAAILQQTAFVRKQFNISATETKQTIQRLAGESHLASPDASSIHAWDTATRDSSEQTRSAVLEHVKSGSESITHAREVLAALQAKRSALEHLKGNV